MKLRYRILWFEDDDEIVNVTVGPRILKYLESLGFVCEYQHQLNGDRLSDLVKAHNFDLILTDLNLGDGSETGERIIEHIRDYDILTEVLLYSGVPTAIDEIKEKTGKVVERISFSAGLQNLPDKIKSIISLSVKKVQDVNNMRGLVIAQTIDLENSMTDMVSNYFSAAPSAALDPSRRKIAKDIHDKKIKHHQEKLGEIQEIDPPSVEKMMGKNILTAEDTYQAVMRMIKAKTAEIQVAYEKEGDSSLKQLIKDDLDVAAAIRDIFKDFHAEILELRNLLAHVKEETEANGTPYLLNTRGAGEPIRFDEARYSDIRKVLKKHADNLRKISSIT